MKSDAFITFFVDDQSRPSVRVADGIVWLSFGTGSTRVAVAVTLGQAAALGFAIDYHLAQHLAQEVAA